MALSCGAPGGLWLCVRLGALRGAVHLGLRRLRGPWGAWLPLPRVVGSTLDTRFVIAVYFRAMSGAYVFFFGAFLWGPWGVVALRTPECTAGGSAPWLT